MTNSKNTGKGMKNWWANWKKNPEYAKWVKKRGAQRKLNDEIRKGQRPALADKKLWVLIIRNLYDYANILDRKRAITAIETDGKKRFNRRNLGQNELLKLEKFFYYHSHPEMILKLLWIGYILRKPAEMRKKILKIGTDYEKEWKKRRSLHGLFVSKKKS